MFENREYVRIIWERWKICLCEIYKNYLWRLWKYSPNVTVMKKG